jgi:hypothetical protein
VVVERGSSALDFGDDLGGFPARRTEPANGAIDT